MLDPELYSLESWGETAGAFFAVYSVIIGSDPERSRLSVIVSLDPELS